MTDLIDRQKIKARFEPWLKVKGYSEGELNIIRAVLYEITIMPSAQPERIKGHWVEIASSNHTYKCSVCGRLLVNITDGKNNVAKNYPYCHCGADMRGE